MTILTNIGVAIAQWLITWLANEIAADVKALIASWKSDQALAKNQAALAAAVKSGDLNAEKQAAKAALNNDGGT